MSRDGWALAILWCGTWPLAGCGFAATPRLEDAVAPHDYLAQTRPPTACAADVQVLSPGQVIRPYRELANLSASCYPGAPRVCEQRLADRACALHADALIVREPESGGTPPGSSGQSLISISARAVRWTE